MTPGSRTIITTPPQVGKTTTAVLGGSLFALDVHEHPKIALCTYGQTYSDKWSIELRNTIRRNQAELGWGIDTDFARAGEWRTTLGGEFLATSIDGGLTGRPVDILWIDDPYKNWKDAYSEAWLKKVEHWWYSTAYTRLQPGAAVVLIMTRWNKQDIAGQLEEKMSKGGDQWEVINFPAIALDEHDPMGRKPGEPLWPARYSAADYAKIRINVTDLIWWPLYQGRPRSTLEKYFDRLVYYGEDDIPDPAEMEAIVIAVDTPQKDRLDSDWFAAVVLGKKDDRAYLLDVVHEHAAFMRQAEILVALNKRWPAAREILIEDASTGPSLDDYLVKHHRIRKVRLVPATGDKKVRAAAITPMVQAGQLVVPDPKVFPWAQDYVTELLEFPDAKHDDQVDSTTLGVRDLLFDVDVKQSGFEPGHVDWLSRWTGKGRGD